MCALCKGNPADLLDIAKRFSFQAVLNATVSVDTFFLLRYVFSVAVFYSVRILFTVVCDIEM